MASIVPRNPDSLVSGFGDPVTVELTPRVQIDAVGDLARGLAPGLRPW